MTALARGDDPPEPPATGGIIPPDPPNQLVGTGMPSL